MSGVCQIPLRDRDDNVRAYALVDASDFERIGERRWYLASHGYVRGSLPGRKKIYLHREVMGLVAGDRGVVDHINGDKLDNRRANLRVVTQMENCQNLHRGRGISRHRGVTWGESNNGWIGSVVLYGKRHYLGTFPTEALAAAAVDAFLASYSPMSPQARTVAA